MRPKIRLLRKTANCVGPRPGGAHAVSWRFRCALSRDDELAVEPGHSLGQRHAVDHVAPKGIVLGDPPQFRKPAAQEERKALAALLEPVPPSHHRSQGTTRAATAIVERRSAEQQQQHDLLHGPAIPAPRGHEQRQPGACVNTSRAQVARHRHRFARRAAGAAITLAEVAAMSPQSCHPAERTGLRPVNVRVSLDDGGQVLGQCGDTCYDPVHRLVSVVRVCLRKPTITKEYRPILLVQHPALETAPLPSTTWKDPGHQGTHQPWTSADVTQATSEHPLLIVIPIATSAVRP